MIEGINLMFGIGILLFLVLYTAFNLENKHFLLKALLVATVFFTFMLIPKAAIDTADYCDTYVTGANTSVANYTTYSYERICFDNPYNTEETFFKGTKWFSIFFITYMFLYVMYELFAERIVNKYKSMFSRGKK